MTEQERLEIIERIAILKEIYDIHQKRHIIKDEEERNKHLFAIIDAIQALEAELNNDLDHLN
jgi:hypothetical protein